MLMTLTAPTSEGLSPVALGFTPWVTATVLLLLATWRRPRQRRVRWILGLTIAVAAAQALGLSGGLNEETVELTAGATLLAWLGTIVDEFGVGFGRAPLALFAIDSLWQHGRLYLRVLSFAVQPPTLAFMPDVVIHGLVAGLIAGLVVVAVVAALVLARRPAARGLTAPVLPTGVLVPLWSAGMIAPIPDLLTVLVGWSGMSGAWSPLGRLGWLEMLVQALLVVAIATILAWSGRTAWPVSVRRPVTRLVLPGSVLLALAAIVIPWLVNALTGLFVLDGTALAYGVALAMPAYQALAAAVFSSTPAPAAAAAGTAAT